MYCAVVVWLPLKAAEVYNKNNVHYFTFYCYYFAIINVTFKKTYFFTAKPLFLLVLLFSRVTKSPSPPPPQRGLRAVTSCLEQLNDDAFLWSELQGVQGDGS